MKAFQINKPKLTLLNFKSWWVPDRCSLLNHRPNHNFDEQT